MSGFTEGVCGHLGVASLGLGVALVVAAPWLRARSRRVRSAYRLGVVLLGAALALPAAQLAAEHLGPGALAGGARDSRAEPVSVASAEPVSVAPARRVRPAGIDAVPADVPAAPAAATPARAGAPFPVAGHREPPSAPSPEASDALRDGAKAVLAALEGLTRGAAREARRVAPAAPVFALLATVWALGVLALLGRLARRLARTRRLVRRAHPVDGDGDDAEVVRLWRRVRAESPRAGRVRLLVSNDVHVPACTALFGRAILLPADPVVRASGPVLRGILLHELVHLERRDAWVQLAEELLRALYWFHPAAHFLARRLALLRELACDQEVVERAGGRHRYAALLVEYAARVRGLATGTSASPTSAAVLPLFSSNGQLTRRIEMLLAKNTPPSRGARLVSASLALGAFACVWGGQLALAGTLARDARPDPSAPAREAQAQETPERSDERPLPTIGVTLDTPGPALAAQLGGAPDDLLLVTGVRSGSAAAAAGFEKWDVIVAIDGEKGVSMKALHAAKRRWADGAALEFAVVRAGQHAKLTLPAGHTDRSSSAESAESATEPRLPRAPRELREPREPREPRELREPRAPRDLREPREPRARDLPPERGADPWLPLPDLSELRERLPRDAGRAYETAKRLLEERLRAQGDKPTGSLPKDALEVARHYYDLVAPEEFAEALRERLPEYRRELERLGTRLDDDVATRLGEALRALEARPELYLDQVKRYLEYAPMMLRTLETKEVREQLERAFEAWSEGRSRTPEAYDPFDSPRPEARERSDALERADAVAELEAEFDEMMRRAEEQVRRLDALRARLEELRARRDAAR